MRHYLLVLILFFTPFIAFGQNESYKNGLEAFKAKDYVKAFKLLKPFADSGDAMAEFAVGLCYLNPDINLKNDSLAEHYLISSAEKFNTQAMGMLSVYYFQKSVESEKVKIQALVWAEIAGAYDPAFNATTTRFLIRSYLNEKELNEVERILKDKKSKYDKINLDAFYKLNKQVKSINKDPEKTKIPENKYKLIENPYADWVYRWKLERFECDTMYYTTQVESSIIDSALNKITKVRSFEILSSQSDNSKPFIITKEEQDYLVKELEQLKSYKWPPNMFPYSKGLEQTEIQPTFNNTENLPTEQEKNMCSIVYTFSRPIFIRNGTIALSLDQKRYRTNYTQLEFDFYKLDNKQWNKLATVYKYYESPKK
jgi:hypothetical protein